MKYECEGCGETFDTRTQLRWTMLGDTPQGWHFHSEACLAEWLRGRADAAASVAAPPSGATLTFSGPPEPPYQSAGGTLLDLLPYLEPPYDPAQYVALRDRLGWPLPLPTVDPNEQ